MVLAAAVIATIFLITLWGNEAGTEERIDSTPEDGGHGRQTHQGEVQTNNTQCQSFRTRRSNLPWIFIVCVLLIIVSGLFGLFSIPLLKICTFVCCYWKTYMLRSSIHLLFPDIRDVNTATLTLFGKPSLKLRCSILLFNTKRYDISCCAGDPRA